MILLEVLFVEHQALPPSHVQWIANERGVSVQVVEAELDARAEVQGAKRYKIREGINKRQAKIRGLSQRIFKVERVIAEMDLKSSMIPTIASNNPGNRAKNSLWSILLFR